MRLILLFYCIFISNICFAYNSTNSFIKTNYNVELEYDKDLFDDDFIEDAKQKSDYDYTEEANSITWWTDFKEWLEAQWKKLFGEDFDTNSIWFKLWQILPYLIIPLALVLILWYIIRINPGNQVMRQHNKSKVILTDEEEILMQKNLQDLADKAIEQNEYRMAVRYLYLNSIKRLDMKRIIRYANDKTNYEYVREIQFADISRLFGQLTRSYEQIWYGQMVFDEAFFQTFKSQSEQLHQQLDQKQYAQV